MERNWTMAEEKEIPEPAEESAGEAGAEQGGAEQPAGAEQAPTAEKPKEVQQEQASEEISKDARMWSMFCHLAGLAAFLHIVPVIGGVMGPLIIWQIKKDEYSFVDEQGKEAVNFQISILIYGALLLFTCIGAVLLPAVVVFDVVFLLIAAIKANNGEHYRYPLCIRFIE